MQPGALGQQSGQGSPYSALRFASSGAAAAEEGRSPQLELPPPPPLRFEFSWRKLWRCVPAALHRSRAPGMPALSSSHSLAPLPRRFMGPGWLMSLAYLDPGNLESDLQQGATTGATQVWVLWWSTVIGFVMQEGGSPH